MDATTNIKARLPSRHVTEGPARAPHRPYSDAPEFGIDVAWFDLAGVFKKTPYIAGSKLGGRYVAKDMFEVGGIPLLMKTPLDHGFLHVECMTVAGRTIAENLKSVKCSPNQDVVCQANDPIAVTGGVVGLKTNLALAGAIAAVTHSGGKAGKVSHADA
jgi:dihydroxy-acid dehydratase